MNHVTQRHRDTRYTIADRIFRAFFPDEYALFVCMRVFGFVCVRVCVWVGGWVSGWVC